MRLAANIVITEGAEHLQHLLATEQGAFANTRSSFTAEREGNELRIRIEASDAVALRAVVTTITRVIALYEKAKHGTQGTNPASAAP